MFRGHGSNRARTASSSRPSIRTILSRDFRPRSRTTERSGIPSSSARNLQSRALASPSIGLAFSLTLIALPCWPTTRFPFAFGTTWKLRVAISIGKPVSLRSPRRPNDLSLSPELLPHRANHRNGVTAHADIVNSFTVRPLPAPEPSPCPPLRSRAARRASRPHPRSADQRESPFAAFASARNIPRASRIIVS